MKAQVAANVENLPLLREGIFQKGGSSRLFVGPCKTICITNGILPLQSNRIKFHVTNDIHPSFKLHRFNICCTPKCMRLKSLENLSVADCLAEQSFLCISQLNLLGILGIEKMSSHYEWSQLFNAHSKSSPEVQLFRAIFQRPLDT